MTNTESLAPESERQTLCERLAPEIAALTLDYYSPDTPHPIMRSPAAGGALQRSSVQGNVETLTATTASGMVVSDRLRDTWVERRLPASIKAENVLWSVATRQAFFSLNPGANRLQPESTTVNHSVSFWDGARWHTVRETVGTHSAHEREWLPSSLLPEELVAVQAMAAQTRGLHQVAEAYGNNSGLFEEEVLAAAQDAETRRLLEVGLVSSSGLSASDLSGLSKAGYMDYYGTGYQSTGVHLRTINLAAERRLAGPALGQDPIFAALHDMYEGTARLPLSAVTDRANQAADAGNPYPLPSEW